MEKDLTKAFEWFTKSAQQGSEYAEWWLRRCLAEKNQTEAVEGHTKSAQQGEKEKE